MTRYLIHSLTFLIAIFISTVQGFSKIILPDIISSNMVLQQDTKIKFWGRLDKTSNFKIHLSWNDSVIHVKATNKGTWVAYFHTPKAGGPHTITLNDDSDKIILNDILIGDVWLCSGQSNMEMPIKGYPGQQPVYKSLQTIASAREDIPIRMFTVRKEYSISPKKEECKGVWEKNNSLTVSNFSATAYFFGLQLYHSLNVPIGLINASWGGSAIESWMDISYLKMYLDIEPIKAKDIININHPEHKASLLYNAMLYPLQSVKIKGMIWYQGERNRFNPSQYENLMVDFVHNMRNLFADKKLPFYFVQIAPFPYPDTPGKGVLLREAQEKASKRLKDCGMAVITDKGDSLCIHPMDKEVVGQRLAYLALQQTYLKQGINAKSPELAYIEVKGSDLFLTFENTGVGITSLGKSLNLFEVAGNDSIFYHANAQIISPDKIKVSTPKVKSPIFIRYAFKDYVRGELFGCNGIPVSSFRANIYSNIKK